MRREGCRWVWLFGAWCISVCLAAGVLTADTADDASVSRIDAAFEQLTNEANDLGTVKSPEHRAVLTRPHRVLDTLKPGDGPAVIHRMAGKLTGDPYGDAYIRWHLMPLVQDYLHERALEPSGDETLPNDVAHDLRDLFKQLPPEAEARYVSPYTEEGQRINQQIARLRAQTRITVGVPPFEKTYSGRSALPHMTPAARKKAEPIVKEIERLQDQVKQMRDRDIDRVNERYREVAKLMRAYRFDLAYAMVQSGDAALLNDLAGGITVLIRQRQRAGIDLTNALGKAMRDGYLGRYDGRALAGLRSRLAKAAMGARHYEKYLRGEEPVPGDVKPEMRCYAEYVGHMLDLLKDPSRVRAFELIDRDRAEDESAFKPVGPFDPRTLSIDDVRAAIRAAVQELYTARHQPERDDAYAPGPILPYEFVRQDSYYWYLNRYRRKDPVYQEVVNETGNHALVVAAMLTAGQSYQDPRLHRWISWVLTSDTPYTYDRGMRLIMLSRLPLGSYEDAAVRDVTWLGSAVNEAGNFNELYYEGKAGGYGDHGSGLYGVLGLWAANRMGLDLNDKKVWTPIDKHWRLTQQKTPGDAPAGWAVGMLNGLNARQADTPITTNTRTTVTGPMTAGGVAALTLTERYLDGKKFLEPGRESISPELRKGLAWLDANFDPSQSQGADWYYYMWTIQRVGQATGRRTFNGIDWYRQITAEMLNRQGDDGLWEDPSGLQGKLLSTGFALSYLAGALQPIAVSKVRFDGAWNNRPNDLWNFVDYASDDYEIDTTWQIVSLDQPVYELADSPLLYLATHEPFELSPDETSRLREYIEMGGMLVINPEAPFGRLRPSIEKLVEAVCPGRSLEPVEPTHAFYSLHTKLNPNVGMLMVSNGVRPLVVVFKKDIGRGLQSNDPKRYADSFIALSNVYLFAVGTEANRTRLASDYVVPVEGHTGQRVSAARIRYQGDYDPEPGALRQLTAVMGRDAGVNLDVQTLNPDQLTDQRIAFMTAARGGKLDAEQAEALRQWVEAGGTLWVDAAGGSTEAVNAAHALLSQVFPDQAVLPLDQTSPLITGDGLGPDGQDARRVTYSRFAQRRMGQANEPRLQAITIDGRAAVIYSPEDLTAALAGCDDWQIFGYSPASARKLAVNGVLAAMR